MSTDSGTNEFTEFVSLPADMDDDSCRLQYIEIVPLTRDTDHSSTTECDSGDLSTEAEQEILPVVKQEADDSCRPQCIEIVSVTGDTDAWNTDSLEDIARDTRDTDGLCTTECDSGDWSDEVNQETLPVVKQERHDVCYVVY